MNDRRNMGRMTNPEPATEPVEPLMADCHGMARALIVVSKVTPDGPMVLAFCGHCWGLRAPRLTAEGWTIFEEISV